MSEENTNLIEALKLARLDPKERFTKENITKIHKGLKPYYKLLTSVELPDDVVIVGYGKKLSGFDLGAMFDSFGAVGFGGIGSYIESLYYCKKQDAIIKGWISVNDPEFREPIKWITDRKPTEEDLDDSGCVAIPFNFPCDDKYTRVDLTCFYIKMPWQTSFNAFKMTPDELADIPAECRWPEDRKRQE